jgi:hydroxymethylpyrimidine/phosphomethylpyrimidine kinase
MACGGFGTTAITALTAQNTHGVQGVHAVPMAFLEQQIDSVLSDIGADVIKTGMLPSAEAVRVRTCASSCASAPDGLLPTPCHRNCPCDHGSALLGTAVLC